MEKENKNKFWKGVLVGALVMAFSGLIVVGVATGISVIGRTVIDNQVQAEVIESPETSTKAALDMTQIGAKIQTIQSLVDQSFLFDEDMKELENGIYSGFMYGLGDPYSTYYSPAEFTQLMESTEGVYCGIGAMVSQHYQTKLSTIVRVFKGSPAEKAGLLPGDVLVEVGEMDVTTMDLDLIVSKHIRGEEGSSVNIRVLREENYEDLMVRRAQIEVPTVEYSMLEDNVGYVQLLQFDVVTTSQFIKAIEDLEQQGMERLVLDLRNNPGGVLDTAVEIAAYLIPETPMDGMIVYTKDKNGKGERYLSKKGKIVFESDDPRNKDSRYPKTDGHQLEVPIAVLVNENSASASELLAGCLKDYKWATLVGTTTYGKGIVQRVFPLADDSAVKLTTHHYYTPSGYSIHEKGVAPDVEVELTEGLEKKVSITPEEDNQLQKAVEVVKGIVE